MTGHSEDTGEPTPKFLRHVLRAQGQLAVQASLKAGNCPCTLSTAASDT